MHSTAAIAPSALPMAYSTPAANAHLAAPHQHDLSDSGSTNTAKSMENTACSWSFAETSTPSTTFGIHNFDWNISAVMKAKSSEIFDDISKDHLQPKMYAYFKDIERDSSKACASLASSMDLLFSDINAPSTEFEKPSDAVANQRILESKLEALEHSASNSDQIYGDFKASMDVHSAAA
ncbi:hypothetical protein LTS18_001545, partial [Coniosporium uncinatum]